MNLVIPSREVVVVIGEGAVHVRVGVAVGAVLAVTVIENVDTEEPSVRVKLAVPLEVKVTPNGVRIVELVILAPVKLH